jgi:hypothetical protein
MDEQKPSIVKTLFVVVTGLIGLVYLLNPTAGFLELIPDNIPIIGNLDEAAATLLVVNTVRYLRGSYSGKKNKKEQLPEGPGKPVA